MTAGQDFVKRIGKLGCVLFLMAALLVTALCFTLGRDPIRGYEPPHGTEYWAEHPEELASELEVSVLPYLEGGPVCEAANGVVVVTADSNQLAAVRGTVLRYFDLTLFEFKER